MVKIFDISCPIRFQVLVSPYCESFRKYCRKRRKYRLKKKTCQIEIMNEIFGSTLPMDIAFHSLLILCQPILLFVDTLSDCSDCYMSSNQIYRLGINVEFKLFLLVYSF